MLARALLRTITPRVGAGLQLLPEVKPTIDTNVIMK